MSSSVSHASKPRRQADDNDNENKTAMKIQIIGRGNVGTNLQAAFRRRGVEPDMVSGHTLEGLREDADIYIYAVADHALEQIVDRVHVSARAVHIHTSGTMPLSVFGEDKRHAGIMYPYMTFSKQHVLEDFGVVPIFIQAAQIDDIAAIYSLALTLSSHVYEITQAEREKLHVAGVLVNNFPNALYRMAADLLRGTNIPYSALLPLIDETAAKVHSLSPDEAQTGPALREDRAVMDKHMSLLPAEDAEIYRLISERIIRNKHQAK